MPPKPLDTYLQLIKESGATWAKEVPASQIVTAPWVRFKCRYGCDGWSASRHCPPNTPTPAETQAVLNCYSRAILVAWHRKSEDRARRLTHRRKIHKSMLELERTLFLDGYYKALVLLAGSCTLCKECDMDKPCKHPGDTRPAMEACGIDVFSTMSNADHPIQVRHCLDEEYVMCGLALVE